MSEQPPRIEAAQLNYAKELAIGALLGAVGAGVPLGAKAMSERLKYQTIGSEVIPSSDAVPEPSPLFENAQPTVKERAQELGKNALNKFASATEEEALVIMNAFDTVYRGARKIRRYVKNSQSNRRENRNDINAVASITTRSPLQKYL